ncbi:TPA: gamma-mobile-trio protein GmtX [Vibrio vulnificus]
MNTPNNQIKIAYEAICEQAKSNKARKSLGIINDICLEQLQSGEINFSVANIGAHSEKKGGPSTQAIRNTSGQLYRDLINVYAESVAKSVSPAIRNKEHDWVNGIENPTIQWLVRDLIAAKTALTAEVNQLKSDLYNAEVPIQVLSKNALSPELDALPSKASYTDSEINALKSAIDPNHLRRKGLSIGERGEIIGSDGKPVFKPGFVKAIEKTLDVNGAE